METSWIRLPTKKIDYSNYCTQITNSDYEGYTPTQPLLLNNSETYGYTIFRKGLHAKDDSA